MRAYGLQGTPTLILIDKAGSRLRIKRMETPADFKEIENELAGVVDAKKKAVESQNFEEAGRLRDKEKELLSAKEGKEREIKESGVDLFDEVRSEEHTSELQSLMRISYAVFCLKKKNKHKKD